MNVFDNITLEEFQNVCRFCVKKQNNLKMIFKYSMSKRATSSRKNVSGEIVKMLELCTGLKVNTFKNP